jgi:hypothetical protein
MTNDPQQQTARGMDYILTTEREVAYCSTEKPFLQPSYCASHVPGRYISFPKVGDEYDFTDAKEAVWVCGRYYSTPAGSSSPIDVKGKKIRILSVSKGSVYFFSRITFETLKL